MINLVNILKYCPEGTKLYSPIFGEVTFKGISSSKNILCKATKYNGEITTVAFTRLGRGYYDFPNAECILFPSKNQRDWNKFRIPIKKGDVIMFGSTCPCLVTGDYHKDTSKWCCGLTADNIFLLNYSSAEWRNSFYIPASEDVKEKLFKAIDDAGYIWNGETLKKKEYQFKPFEKVLVRDNESLKWKCTFYSYFEPDSVYPHVTTSNGVYAMCIPFEGNEHLVGTTNNP